MRILITTGLSGNDVGGPAQYAPNLAREFSAMGHPTKIVSYGRVERFLPPLIRHIYFLFKIIPSTIWANRLITLDTFSVGVPSAFSAKLFGKKITVRVGGDFLWESYVNRTNQPLTLRGFYKETPALNLKEKTILKLTKSLLNWADAIAFNTEWQREICQKIYKIEPKKTVIIRNFVPPKDGLTQFSKKNFIWSGRETKIKNLELLKSVASKINNPDFQLEIIQNLSHSELIERLKNCYAVIHPSYSDICPNFIIEAISFNKPFLMTRESGLSEIFPKGGMSLDPKNEREWEQAIEKMLNEDVYNKYKDELVETTYTHSWNEMAIDFLNTWKNN